MQGHLEQLRESVFACTRCGACREKYSGEMTRTPAFRVCPVREHAGGFEHQCARGKLSIAQGILDGRLGYSPGLIDLIFTEPGCRLCTWVCNQLPRLDPPEVWRAMRRDIVESGSGPPEPLRRKDARVRERHNIFGARADRGRWAEGLRLPRAGGLLYFAGCHASYQQTEIAASTVACLRKGGMDPVYLAGEEWCCGVTQLQDGSIAVAEEMARHNLEAIASSGARTVVTSCAECYASLAIEYPALLGELPFEVMHVSQVLEGMLREGSLSMDAELPRRRVTFHDPCRLGRYTGVFDAPRFLLGAIPGVELVEMRRHREYAWCCGHGADMVPSMRPDLARRIAADRMEEARESGAEAVITSCPRCARGLSRAKGGMAVVDLTVALAGALAS